MLSSLDLARETHKDIAAMLTALGQLWLEGVPVNWQGFYAHERRSRVPLPTYPFEKKRYWIDPPKITEADKPQRFPLPGPAEEQLSEAPRAATEPILQPSRIESPTSDEVPSSATALERIMSEQLQLMAQQLEVLSYCQTPYNGAEAAADSTSLLPARANGCSQSKDEL